MITELRLRGLEILLVRLCPLHGTKMSLSSGGDRTATVVCEYEGHARIIRDLFKKQKNVADLKELGYEQIVVMLGKRPKPIAIVNS